MLVSVSRCLRLLPLALGILILAFLVRRLGVDSIHGYVSAIGYWAFPVLLVSAVWKCSNYKKECQSSCGVYCVVTTSLAYERPIRFLMREMGIGRKRWAKKVRVALEAEEILQIQEPFVESHLKA